MAKINISDVTKKHLKLIGYLVSSVILAYALSILVGKPEAVYLTPVINFLIVLIEKELKSEGYVRAIKG